MASKKKPVDKKSNPPASKSKKPAGKTCSNPGCSSKSTPKASTNPRDEEE